MMIKSFSVFLISATLAGAWLPTFTPGVGLDTLFADGAPLGDHNDSYTFGSPCFADWDGDGLDDLILGYWDIISKGVGVAGTLTGSGGYADGSSLTGKILFCKNVGTIGNPIFEKQDRLRVNGNEIRLWGG